MANSLTAMSLGGFSVLYVYTTCTCEPFHLVIELVNNLWSYPYYCEQYLCCRDVPLSPPSIRDSTSPRDNSGPAWPCRETAVSPDPKGKKVGAAGYKTLLFVPDRMKS